MIVATIVQTWMTPVDTPGVPATRIPDPHAEVLRLFGEDGPSLYRFCRSMLGAGDDAEDVVQEAFLRPTAMAAVVAGARSPHLRAGIGDQRRSGGALGAARSGAARPAAAVAARAGTVVWWTTPFHYYHGAAILLGKSHPPRDLSILVGMGVIAASFAFWRFSHRDI